ELYDVRPDIRHSMLNDLANNLPSELINDWKDSQKDLRDEYIRANGLQRTLSQYTGNETLLADNE
ncbi:MAG: hypothetical protein WBG42_06995, partial [Cryomorphaceae bacterium]